MQGYNSRDMHGICAQEVHEMLIGCMQGNHIAACMRITLDAHVGNNLKRKTQLFPSMFLNEWILIWEHLDHKYEFQISTSLFSNGF